MRVRMHRVSRQKLWVKTTAARMIWCRPQGANYILYRMLRGAPLRYAPSLILHRPQGAFTSDYDVRLYIPRIWFVPYSYNTVH